MSQTQAKTSPEYSYQKAHWTLTNTPQDQIETGLSEV